MALSLQIYGPSIIIGNDALVLAYDEIEVERPEEDMPQDLLINTIKDLRDTVESLQKRVEDLESRSLWDWIKHFWKNFR